MAGFASMFKNPFTPNGGATIDGVAPPPAPGGNGGMDQNNSGNNNNGMRGKSMQVPNGNGQGDDDTGNNGNNNNNKQGDGNSGGINLDTLWQPKKDGEGNNVNKGPKRYIPEVKDEDLNKHLGTLDFTRSIQPEHFAAIAQGGEGAVVALKEIINHVGRAAVKSNYKSAATMFEKGIGGFRDDFSSEIPNHVRGELSLNNLHKDNPLMASPKFAPMVKAIRAQIQEQYPQATPDEIQEATRQYFNEMMDEANSKKEGGDDTQQGNGSVDKFGRKNFSDGQADWESWAMPTTD